MSCEVSPGLITFMTCATFESVGLAVVLSAACTESCTRGSSVVRIV